MFESFNFQVMLFGPGGFPLLLDSAPSDVSACISSLFSLEQYHLFPILHSHVQNQGDKAPCTPDCCIAVAPGLHPEESTEAVEESCDRKPKILVFIFIEDLASAKPSAEG